MNTIRSVWYGWGVLIVAGAGSYWYAKKDIDRERLVRATKRQNAQYHHEARSIEPIPAAGATRNRNTKQTDEMPQQPGKTQLPRDKGKDGQDARASGSRDTANSPSQEANEDPAPTKHAPINEEQQEVEKSKYAPTEVYRTRKGSRLW